MVKSINLKSITKGCYIVYSYCLLKVENIVKAESYEITFIDDKKSKYTLSTSDIQNVIITSEYRQNGLKLSPLDKLNLNGIEYTVATVLESDLQNFCIRFLSTEGKKVYWDILNDRSTLKMYNLKSMNKSLKLVEKYKSAFRFYDNHNGTFAIPFNEQTKDTINTVCTLIQNGWFLSASPKSEGYDDDIYGLANFWLSSRGYRKIFPNDMLLNGILEEVRKIDGVDSQAVDILKRNKRVRLQDYMMSPSTGRVVDEILFFRYSNDNSIVAIIEDGYLYFAEAFEPFA